VLTLNEARHVHACLQSLQWADAVVVLDSGSTDGTRAIADESGARLEHHSFVNYSQQRQHALSLVETEWVFFVDADERVSDALATEVRAAVATSHVDGFRIPRRNDFWGHTMRGGGWWPDYQLRLLRTASASFDPDRAVHEVADVEGPVGELTNPLVHLNYDSVDEFRRKQHAYALLAAQRRLAEGWPYRARQLVSLPAREFWRRYVTLGGWRDGPTGWIVCALSAWYEGVTLARLRELRREGS
jgi:glycosyltransferase involved in cell wall biosynthesis